MNAILESQSRSEDKTISNSQEKLEALDIWFSRNRRALSLVAYRVLGNHEEAEDAVQNCLRAAADNVPWFEHEGAFRCWLVRVLIDEAVLLLSKQSVAPATWCAR
jgi:DNA-directed RNA polymerase specialized sigma24 family protein